MATMIRLVTILFLSLSACQWCGAEEAGLTLNGSVQDQTGAVIPGATLRLMPTNGGTARETTADDTGSFTIAGVIPGQYELRANAEGFESADLRLTVGPTPPGPIRIRMNLRTQTEEIMVSAANPGMSVDPGSNGNGIRLEERTFDQIPTDSENILPVLSSFLNPAAHGVAGPSIIVDGVETEAFDVSSSAIKHIRLNTNPYSVRFRRPGGSRVEVTTREGGRTHYHGGIAAYGRDSSLDARNAFAVTKPYLRKNLVDADLTGPIPGIPASFFLSGERLVDDESSYVNAHTTDGQFLANVPTNQNRTIVIGRFDLRPSKYHTISAFYEYSGHLQSGLGVGGIRLPEQAYSARLNQDTYQISDRYISLRNFINELRVNYQSIHDESGGLATAPAMQVEGDFLGGPSQTYRVERRKKFTIQNTTQYIWGRQTLAFGGEFHPRFLRTMDASDYAGTYYFESLHHFEDGTPLLFTINRGEPWVKYTQHEGLGFLQDDIKLRSNLDMTIGARYEWHDGLPNGNVVAPRLGLAFAPFGDKTVLRAGAGLFYDEYPRQVIRQSILFGGDYVQQLVFRSPSYPDPFANFTGTLPPPSVVRTANNLTLPRLMVASLALEQALNTKTHLTVEFRTLRGEHLYRSRNINAPLSLGDPRPDPDFLNIVQVESSAMMQSNAMEITLSWDASRRFNGTAQYVLSRSIDDTDGPLSLPAYTYNLRPELGPADYDQRHRFNFMGTVQLPWKFNVGTIVALGSRIPYNITTGRDNNGDNFVTDRPPGVTRNTWRGPDLARVDVRLTKSFSVWNLFRHGSQEHNNLSFNIDAFNVFNRTNYNNFIGVVRSHFFGMPNSALPAREIQFSIRYLL